MWQGPVSTGVRLPMIIIIQVLYYIISPVLQYMYNDYELDLYVQLQ